MIRTVLGDIEPEALGFTLGHEHLYGWPPPEFAEADLQLDDEAAALAELRHFKAAGGAAVIEMTTVDYARDVTVLRRLAAASGIHLIAATGFNKAKFADRYSSSLSDEALWQWLVTEVSEGITEPPGFVPAKQPFETKLRAGLIKVSNSLYGPSKDEERVISAAALAHKKTGAPISTHTEKATWALEQASLLIDLGVRPEKLLIGHLDFRPDLAFLKELASLGVYLGLDQFSKEKYLPDAKRLELVVHLCEQGFAGQLILSGDLARKTYWQASGGKGFAYLPKVIVPSLQAYGLSKGHLRQIFYKNPADFLAF